MKVYKLELHHNQKKTLWIIREDDITSYITLIVSDSLLNIKTQEYQNRAFFLNLISNTHVQSYNRRSKIKLFIPGNKRSCLFAYMSL